MTTRSGFDLPSRDAGATTELFMLKSTPGAVSAHRPLRQDEGISP